MKKQLIPIFLAIITFLGLVFFLLGFIYFLNFFPIKNKIIPQLRVADILVGLTIYLKTSVDFALFIGNLMKKYPGTKNRIAIEIGTAFGNGLGTCLVLFVWTFFKEVPLLMAIMILLAALVLLRMASESLDDFLNKKNYPLFFTFLLFTLKKILVQINACTDPFIRFLMPHKAKEKNIVSFLGLLLFGFFIPFILGLDDFAGYIPLFSIVNVFGFATGVFLGHMMLNISLFASPRTTIMLIEKPLVLILGTFAFIGIALWGFYEVLHLLLLIF